MDRRLIFVAALFALAVAGCTGGAGDLVVPSSAVERSNGESDEVITSSSPFGDEEPAPAIRDSDSRPMAPEFPVGLDWLNTDRPLTLEELRGKVVVLDFWTYGCINCIHIIPDLKRLEEEFGDLLVVIGVHSAKFEAEGNTENIREVVLRYEVDHPVVNDSDFVVWQTWGAQAWPTLVLIDPQGRVVGSHAGEGVYAVFRPAIAAVAAEALDELDLEPLDLSRESDRTVETLLRYPGKVIAEGDRLFVADTNHNRIVMSDGDGIVLDVFGSGRAGFDDGEAGSFSGPQGLALSDDGSTLYVADTLNHAVRAVALDTGSISTIAGTGLQGFYPPRGGFGPSTPLYSPWDLEVDGDRLVVAMAGSHQIWSVDLISLDAAPLAGSGGESVRNGPADTAELAQPSGVEVVDGIVYFADSESSSIRFTDGSNVGLLAGTDANLFDFGSADGVGAEARFQHPLGVAAANGVLYVADTYNSLIRSIDIASGETRTLAGSEPGWRDGSDPLFYEPGGIDVFDGFLYVADTNNHSVRRMDLATGIVDTVVFSGLEQYAAPADSPEYRGALVTGPEASVRGGPTAVDLTVQFPDGYKVNPDAPSSFVWSGTGVLIPESASGAIVDPTFPISFTIDVQESGELVGDLSVVYCDVEAESVCLFEQVRLVIPLTVDSEAVATVPIVHTIELPEGF